jgi:alpha-tubulin N-acetyltransferase 1
MSLFNLNFLKSQTSSIINQSSSPSREDHSNNENDESNGTAANVEELAQEMQSLDVVGKSDDDLPNTTPSPSVSPSHDEEDDHANNGTGYYRRPEFFDDPQNPHHQQQYFRNQQNLQYQQQQQQERISPIPYHYNKRQTGKKNVSSFVVGMDNKIEFDQVDDKGFGVVKINRPIGTTSRSNTHEHLNDNESVNSQDSGRTHTADGFFDLKFFSHRLW